MLKKIGNILKTNTSSISGFLLCCLFLGIGSRLLVNNALHLWTGQKDGHLSLVVLGLVFLASGVFLGVRLWKKHYKDASAGRGRRLVRLVFSYLGIQLAAGLLVGLLGLLVFRVSGSYAGALVAVDFTTVLIQGLIRAVFLFLIVEMLLQRRFREDFSVLRKGLFLALALSLVSAGLFLVRAGFFGSLLRMLWDAGTLVFLFLLFLYFAKKQSTSGGANGTGPDDDRGDGRKRKTGFGVINRWRRRALARLQANARPFVYSIKKRFLSLLLVIVLVCTGHAALLAPVRADSDTSDGSDFIEVSNDAFDELLKETKTDVVPSELPSSRSAAGKTETTSKTNATGSDDYEDADNYKDETYDLVEVDLGGSEELFVSDDLDEVYDYESDPAEELTDLYGTPVEEGEYDTTWQISPTRFVTLLSDSEEVVIPAKAPLLRATKNEINIPTDKLIEVTTSTVHGTYHGVGYGCVGYITSAMTGVQGAQDIGKSRMYFKINYDFKKNIPAEAKIDSATMNVYQYRDYTGLTNATFQCLEVLEDWNHNNLTWNNSVSLGLSPAGANSTSVHKKGWHRFDIKNTVNNWTQGLTKNYGLVIKALNETDYGGVFYTPYSTGTGGQVDYTPDKRPNLTIYWSVPDPVPLDYSINSTTVTLRPFSTVRPTGALAFQGVMADGVAAPGSLVTYQLSDAAKNYKGTVPASYSYKYPDSSAFDSYFPKGTQKYKDKDGNYQTASVFTKADFNVAYTINASAAKDGSTGKTVKSEKFLIYKVTQFDTLAKIAAYYGVPLNQILFDNRAQDLLLMAGNTLFIRNPKQNANKPYTPSNLSTSDKAKIDSALLGRGLHCEFGLEPVNLNTGNFYLNATDISIPDIGGDFSIERSYNSKGSQFNSAFGKGWAFSFDEQITQDEDGNIWYKRADGSILVFEKTGEAGTGANIIPQFDSPDGFGIELTVEKAGEKSYDFGDGKQAYPVYRYVFTDNENTQRIFDTSGYLSSVKDEHGNTTRFTYKNGLLEKATSPSGRIYTFTWNAYGLIKEIGLPNGKKLQYGYDNNDNLTSFTNANGAVTRYSYDADHRMTSWTNGNGETVITNVYDADGRVIRQTDGNGHASMLSYSAGLSEAGTTTVTDALGNVTVYSYDEAMRLTCITYPDGTTEERTYDSENRLASETDVLGNTTTYTYNENDDKTGETRFDGAARRWTYDNAHHPTSFTDWDGTESIYTYNDKGGLLSAETAGEIQAAFTYNDSGQVTTITDAGGDATQVSYTGADATAVTDPAGNTTGLSYNALGQVTEITYPTGETATRTYDSAGWQTGEESAEGIAHTYTFDGAGNVTKVSDGDGYTVSFGYDALGNNTWIGNGNGGTYTLVYDALGRQVSMTDAENRTTTTTYDFRGNILSETDAAGDTKTYTYDAAGHLLSETDESGAVTNYTWDIAAGQPASITDALGNTTDYSYDILGRLIEITYPDNLSSSFTYDSLGRTTKITTRSGKEISYTYDSCGNVLAATESGAGEDRTVEAAYNALDLPVTITDANGNVTTYTYDANGNPASVTDPEGGTIQYDLSPAGLPRSVTDALNHTATYAYDGRGNQVRYTDAANYTAEEIYDAQNKLAQITDPLGNETNYTYNQMEELLAVTDALGFTSSYTYNNKGLPETYTDANGNTYHFTYTARGELARQTNPDGTEIRYTYNALGQLIQEERSSGLVTEYEYDSLGRLIKATDNQDLDETYGYDADDNLISYTNSLGEETTYCYDSFGNRTKISYADGREESYSYDSKGNLTSYTDPEGHTTTYTFDAADRLIEEKDAFGRKTDYMYDAAGQLLSVTDPLGNETTYSYDVLGNCVSITDALGNTEELGYNANGDVILQTDKNGNQTIFTYDPVRQVIKATAADGAEEVFSYDGNGNEICYTDAEGRTTETAYDVMNRQASVTQPAGGVTTYSYDSSGALSSESDPLDRVTTYQNDLYGRPVEKALPNGGIYTYSYDPLGRLVEQTAPEGLKRFYSYDRSGNMTEQTDQSNRKTSYTYDIMGRLLSATDPLDLATTYAYDERGNLASITSPLGSTQSFGYDLLDRMQTLTDPTGVEVSGAYDAVGNLSSRSVNKARTTNYSYDPNGNLTGVTNALDETSVLTYDVRNRLKEERNPAGAVTSYSYDKTGLLTAVEDAAGGRMGYTYDADRNIASIFDGEGRTATYTYDLADQMTEAVMGSGENAVKSTYTYDLAGNVASVTDGNGNTTKYEYNRLGQLTSSTNAAGESEKRDYNADAMLSKVTRPDGKTITYDYNKLDLLITTTYSEKDEGQVLYGYDADGRRVTMDDLIGQTTYSYDSAGRITGVKQGDGSVILYNYNSFGELAELIYPDKTKNSYEYDDLGRLVKVTDREGKETTYTYDLAGDMVEVLRGNGTSAELTYDAAHRIESVINKDAKGKVISTYRYTYDSAGLVLTESIEATDVDSGKKTGLTRAFAYDEQGLLSEEAVLDENGKFESRTTYGYDAAGNRTTVTRTAESTLKALNEDRSQSGGLRTMAAPKGNETDKDDVTTFTYDSANRLTEKESKEGTTTYLYDANGNRIREIEPGEEETEYTYDTENRLIAVTDKEGLLLAALYNGDGNRMFTSERVEKTNEYQLYKEKKTATSTKKANAPKTSAYGTASSIFWYAFIQNGLESLTTAPTELGHIWSNTWDQVYFAYNRRADKVKANKEGLVIGENTKINENEEIHPGGEEVTYASEVSATLIPAGKATDTYYDYELRNYVNDINREYVQVLSAYDETGATRELYTYGNERLTFNDGTDTFTYAYTGLQSVSALTDEKGTVVSNYTYAAWGIYTQSASSLATTTATYNETTRSSISSDGNFAATNATAGSLSLAYISGATSNPYSHNGEYTDESTGFFFLRARYYDPNSGTFLTQDSYAGNILDALSQNRYTYAEDDPINYIDPSGHRAVAAMMTDTGKNNKGRLIKAINPKITKQPSAKDIARSKNTTKPASHTAEELRQDQFKIRENNKAKLAENARRAENMRRTVPAFELCSGEVGKATVEDIESVLNGNSLFAGLFSQDMIARAIAAGKLDIINKDRNWTLRALCAEKGENDPYIHIRQSCWQMYFGYSWLYDFGSIIGVALGGGTIKVKTESIYVNGELYTIGSWKGDYLNYGPGTETAIYRGDWLDASNAMDIRIRMDQKLEYTDEYMKKHPNAEKAIIDYIPDKGDLKHWATSFNPYREQVYAKDVQSTTVMHFGSSEAGREFFEKMLNDSRNKEFISKYVNADDMTITIGW